MDECDEKLKMIVEDKMSLLRGTQSSLSIWSIYNLLCWLE